MDPEATTGLPGFMVWIAGPTGALGSNFTATRIFLCELKGRDTARMRNPT